MKLNGSTILLTGASGGIGAAAAKALDQQGAQLLLVGRNEQALNTLKQQLSGKHLIVLADINTHEGREQIFQQCTQCNGIDLMINLAGILDFGFFEQQSDHCIEQMLTTNLVSPILLCHRLIPILKQREEAGIVNVGSTFGSIGHPGFTTYCASKFGLRGFTEALRRELADTSIRVLYLAPRATDTSLNSDAVTALNSALGNKTDSPEQVTNELISLVSSNQHQRYMGWPEKLFVWLNALFPSLVHGALIKKIPIIRKFSK